MHAITTTKQLREINARSKKHGFDKLIATEKLDACRPSQSQIMLAWDPEDWVEGALHPPTVRAIVRLNTQGDRGPIDAWIDMTEADWNSLNPDSRPIRENPAARGLLGRLGRSHKGGKR